MFNCLRTFVPSGVGISLVLSLAFPSTAAGAQSNLPSKEEISELANKADQQVTSFERSLRTALPWLDKADPNQSRNYLDAATAAHQLVGAIKKNGPTIYGLVGLLATLDDLSLDAANGSLQMFAADSMNVVSGKQPDGAMLVAITALSSAGRACNDIAELLLHATLRYVKVSEDLLEALLKKQD